MSLISGLTASVPTFNGPMNYVRKLVLCGEKVGIVSQTESAAEKKVNQTSTSGPFARKVTEMYTASTFLEELYDEQNRTFHIMSIFKDSCLVLTPILGKMTLHKTSKTGLKDILNAVEPFEIIIEDEIEAVQDYVHDQRQFRDNPIRLEIIKNAQVDLESIVLNEKENSLAQIWPSFSQNDIKTFQLMHQYLSQFCLEKLVFSSNFELNDLTSVISSNVMKLPQMTIESLELNILLKLINLAKTRPGKRLFKVWMFNPMTIQAEIGQVRH